MASLTWPQSLAWRMRRQLLDPIGTESVEGVVGRLGAVAETAGELAIRTRRQTSEAGEVDRALADGRIINTFAFRGAAHLLTPEDGGVYLALRASSRMWELPSWQSYYGLAPSDWPELLEAARQALADGPLSRAELGAAITNRPKFKHLGFAFGDGGGTLLKPLAWQGVMSFGPARDGHSTYQLLEGNPRWAGTPGLEEAGARAVEAYFRAYGPATPDHLRYFLGSGLGAGGKQIRAALSGLGDRLASIEVDGEAAYILREDLDDLAASVPSGVVRLLPGYDPWVLGPGTADPHVVPPGRRALVSRQANIVIRDGVVSGTWAITRAAATIKWFAESGPPPEAALANEVARLGSILDRPLELDWTISR